MPVLHKYVDKDSHYAVTKIGSKIVTFQLSRDGEEKLLSSGVQPGHTFSRAFLLDLYRTGEAFTHGSGPGSIAPPIDPRQMPIIFPDDPADPEPETMFPSCSLCSSPSDIHLVEIKDNVHYVSLLCPDCRSKKISEIHSSIPLPLVTRGILNRLLEMNNIKKVDASVSVYQKLLDAQFSAKWEALAKTKSFTQEKLFSSDDTQGKLI